MKKRKRLGVLLLTAALICIAVQPVSAEESGAGNSDTENPSVESSDMETPEAKTQDTSTEQNTATQENPTEETMDKDTELEALSAKTTDPRVTTESITWNGGLLKIPVDLGSYTADDLWLMLYLPQENDGFISTYLTLDGNFAVYSPMSDFELSDEEPFWTKQGNYKATLQFYSADDDEIISNGEFTVVVPTSSELWQVEEQVVKFDGSQDINFSFKNGTNYYELQSISSIAFYMWEENSGEIWVLGEGLFTFDMSAGTLTIEKNVARDFLIDAVQGAAELEAFPTHACLAAYAVTSSGDEIEFNVTDRRDFTKLYPVAWELDLSEFDWTNEELEIVPEVTDYSYTKGDQGGATIKCTGALEDFVSVYMDGFEVDPSNYTLESGSTILTFSTKYLNTLSVGKHTVTLNYTYGYVNTELTVRANTSSGSGSSSLTNKPKSGSSTTPATPAETTTPTSETATAGTVNTDITSGSTTSVQTGDDTPVMLWVLAAMLAFGTCGVIGWKRYSGKL